MESVWFDFGNGPKRHDEDSLRELNAFIAGVQFAMSESGVSDYRQFDTIEETTAPSDALEAADDAEWEQQRAERSWKVSHEPNGTFIRTSSGGLVATLEAGFQPTRDEHARVIVAASKMLAALERIAEPGWLNAEDTERVAREAIAAAKGGVS